MFEPQKQSIHAVNQLISQLTCKKLHKTQRYDAYNWTNLFQSMQSACLVIKLILISQIY
jgi:hypothetical protein